MRLAGVTLQRPRWRWVLAGIAVSCCIALFCIDHNNLAVFSPYQIWFMWLVCPYGMAFGNWASSLRGDLLLWLGPPIIYGLVLSLFARTKRWGTACLALLIIHALVACIAAFTW